MRTPRLSLIVVLALLSACQSTPDGARPGSSLADASIANSAPASDLGRDPAGEVDGSGSVSSDLLQAALHCLEEQQRVAMENIVNANSTGYKRSFVELDSAQVTVAGASYQVPLIRGVVTEFSSGALDDTGRVLDVAIDGDGFFLVALPDGKTGLTRDGTFQIDADGYLVTAAGHRVTPPIQIPLDVVAITISAEGSVVGRQVGSTDELVAFGQLDIVRLSNPRGLVPTSWGVMLPANESELSNAGAPGSDGRGLLRQGCLERSNVETLREILDLQRVRDEYQLLAGLRAQCSTSPGHGRSDSAGKSAGK